MKNDPWRLKFHVMPETGWLNDPNGAINLMVVSYLLSIRLPENPLGGATHWGHMTSRIW